MRILNALGGDGGLGTNSENKKLRQSKKTKGEVEERPELVQVGRKIADQVRSAPFSKVKVGLSNYSWGNGD